MVSALPLFYSARRVPSCGFGSASFLLGPKGAELRFRLCLFFARPEGRRVEVLTLPLFYSARGRRVEVSTPGFLFWLCQSRSDELASRRARNRDDLIFSGGHSPQRQRARQISTIVF